MDEYYVRAINDALEAGRGLDAHERAAAYAHDIGLAVDSEPMSARATLKPFSSSRSGRLYPEIGAAVLPRSDGQILRYLDWKKQ